MKLAVTILVMLGLLAAGSAALLVNVVKARFGPDRNRGETVQVLVVRENQSARKRLEEQDVELKPVPVTGLPRGFFTDSTQAVGKVLKVAVVKGQPLTQSLFIIQNSIDDLLRPGMLAFSASIPKRSTAVDLLYPGCIVDIFATFPLKDKQKGDAVVTPLLQKIQVLGIKDKTVVTSEEEAATSGRGSGSYSASVTVTLEVTARQAAALQLALDRGTLGLAMRNPTDEDWNPMEPMVMKEGRLTAASETLDPQTLAWFSEIQRLLMGGEEASGADSPEAAGAAAGESPMAAETDPNAAGKGARDPLDYMVGSLERQPRVWRMDVIRGQTVTEKELPLEEQQEPDGGGD